MKYDLIIAYRVYPGITKVPPVFPNNKYKLTKLCLESFKTSLEGLKFKVYVLLDACPDEYESLFNNIFNKDELEIIKLDRAGNKVTFRKQIEILSTQDESEFVYFAEDDYFYIKKIKNMIDLLKNEQADFVTPYEHPSSYEDNNVIDKKIMINDNQRYVSVQHACLTFMTTKTNLLKNKKFLLIFSNYFGSDFVVWGCITLGCKYFKYYKLIFNFKNYSIENIKVFGSMLFFAWHRFLFNKKYRLVMPIDTIATHMESNFLSPGIDWDIYFKDKQ